MGERRSEDEPAGSREPLDESLTEELTATLDARIALLEGFHPQSDGTRWDVEVLALRDAARAAGAERITRTACLLLDARASDDGIIPELLTRLSSEGRILALEIACKRREEALARELGATRLLSGREPA